MQVATLPAVVFAEPDPPALPGLCDVCDAEPEWARYVFGCGLGAVYLCELHLIAAIESKAIPKGATIFRLPARWVI